VVRDRPGWRTAVLALLAFCWAAPGPVVGLGLKALIGAVIELPHTSWLARALYYGPSPLPVVWVHLVRFFPCAVAVTWPVVRLLPRELPEAAALDGAGPLGTLRLVTLPLTLPALLRAALAVGVLSLGELSAGKLVSTPNLPTFAEALFDQMHYGVTNDLAVRCLLLLAVAGAGAALLTVPGRLEEEAQR